MNGPLQQLVQIPRRVLSLLIHGSANDRVAAGPKPVSKAGAEAADVGKRALKKLESDVGSLAKEIRTTASELRLLREELRDRLLQYNLQLGRLAGIATNGGGVSRHLSNRSVPLSPHSPLAEPDS